jgi:hypothetical protein
MPVKKRLGCEGGERTLRGEQREEGSCRMIWALEERSVEEGRAWERSEGGPSMA